MRKEYIVRWIIDSENCFSIEKQAFDNRSQAADFAQSLTDKGEKKVNLQEYTVLEPGDRVSWKDYIEILYREGALDDMSAEMCWSGGFNATIAINFVESCAKDDKIELIEDTDPDYDVENDLYDLHCCYGDKSCS